MQDLPFISHTEALFGQRADELLPLEQAKDYRSETGALVYQWDAPCNAVGGLWVTVYDQQEIMLSSKICHTHVERWRTERDNGPGEDIWAKMIDEAVVEAKAIIKGEVAFIETYNADGTKFSTGMTPTKHLAERLRRTRELLGEGITERAFTWFREVTNDS